jgi:hypothetical protein
MIANFPLRLLGLLLLTLTITVPGCQALFRPDDAPAPFRPGFEQQQVPGRQGDRLTPAVAAPSRA